MRRDGWARRRAIRRKKNNFEFRREYSLGEKKANGDAREFGASTLPIGSERDEEFGSTQGQQKEMVETSEQGEAGESTGGRLCFFPTSHNR